MISLESVSSAMPPLSPKQTRNGYGQFDFGRVIGEKEEICSGDNEKEEVWSGSSNKECDEIGTIDDGTEASEKCKDRVEKPKVGMTFNSSDEAYMYYCRFAKEEGFAVYKRTSRKGRDGKLSYVTLSCSRGGKAKVTTSNPVKPHPQSKIDCPAHVTIVIQWDGKWRLNRIVLEHNHNQSPSNVRYLKCNRVLDEHAKKRLELNDDNSSRSIEVRRHDNMCNLFNEVVDLAEESQEKYDMVMTRVRELKRELVEASVVCGKNMGSKKTNDSFSLGDGVTKTKQSTSILDPEGLRRKRRPPCKRMQGVVEKTIKKKRETKNKTLPKKKAKEVEEIVVDHVFGTQESIANVNSQPSYIGQSMWPNMMPHNMHPNMAQCGSIFQFSPSSCPTVTGFNQFMHTVPSSQTNMPTEGAPVDQLPVFKGKTN